MGRRRKGQAVNGWLILDKPAGLTSTKAVGRTRWLFDAQKAGHAGTLDPLATGVLPIAFGEATKTVPYAVDGVKTYRFTVRFGAETDTDDTEGSVTATSDTRPTRADIEAALPQFIGEIEQIPPRFSALKVDGARAYDLARDQEDFELPARTVSIDRLSLLEVPDPETCVLEAECGKGTYVRALARDLGRALGCLGHVATLRRTRVGGFTLDEAIPLETVEQAAEEGREALRDLLQPVEKALVDLPAVPVSPADAANLRLGRAVLLRGRDAPVVAGAAYAVSRGAPVAIGEVAHGEFHPSRVFILPD
ncbi:MAG: tRNA pseudouridine(55) synthase TruB [Methyloceanibacter sp.]|nr:tRNA pseudouridine(55) synthase TruB [Methyloceanibacter sp.]